MRLREVMGFYLDVRLSQIFFVEWKMCFSDYLQDEMDKEVMLVIAFRSCDKSR